MAHDGALHDARRRLFLAVLVVPDDLRPADRPVYDLLVECARTGQPCPSNRELCHRFKFHSIATPTLVLQRLERLGFIRITTYTKYRVVEIVATEQQTRNYGGALHSRTLHKIARGDRQVRMVTPPPPRQPPPPAPPSKTCQYYAGDPRHCAPCGKLSLPGYSYCPKHKAICYVRVTIRDER